MIMKVVLLKHSALNSTDGKLYKIEEFTTTGWHITNPEDVKLTKEQAKQRLQGYLNEGYAPDRLRAVPDNA